LSKRPPHSAASVSAPATPLRLPVWAWVGGVLALGFALAASGSLVWQHFSGKALPGCGPQSGCAGIESHPMGKIPFPGAAAEWAGFAGWPASFLGATFYAGLVAWWVLSGRSINRWLRWMVWAGIAVSLAYVVAIVQTMGAGKEPCKYCIASHVANFALLAFMEIGIMVSRSSAPASGLRKTGLLGLPALCGAVVVVLSTGALAVAEGGRASRARAEAESARAEAERAMLQQAADAARRPQAAPTESWNFGPQGFTGRYREGPAEAVARIVIYSDYQCQQCKRIESEARQIRAKFPDKVSVSHKHYPWCSDCNKYLGGQTLHANACWAARAAETAAILKGNDGFWQVHRWLFDRGGGFTDRELSDGLQQLGYDPKVFIPVMTGEGTLRPVQQDVDEAQALGISGTPMVFINGVELKGWEAPRALERTVEAVLNSGAAPTTSANDRPVLAREKYIADWRDETARSQVAGASRHALVNGEGTVEVVVFGDFLESNTAKADAELRAWATKPVGSGGKPIRYIYRFFPGDKACNPSLSRTFFEHGCLAASAAEAAGVVGGPEAYWKMHEWLMTNQKSFGPGSLAAAASAANIDPAAFVAAVQSSQVRAALDDDLAASLAFNVGQIPCIFVNGKVVKRWWREGDNVMERIIDEAAARK